MVVCEVQVGCLGLGVFCYCCRGFAGGWGGGWGGAIIISGCTGISVICSSICRGISGIIFRDISAGGVLCSSVILIVIIITTTIITTTTIC